MEEKDRCWCGSMLKDKPHNCIGTKSRIEGLLTEVRLLQEAIDESNAALEGAIKIKEEREAVLLQICAMREWVGKECGLSSAALDLDALSGGDGRVEGARLRAFQEMAQKLDAGDFAQKQSESPISQRERCAKVADEFRAKAGNDEAGSMAHGIAQAIRSLS